VDSGEAGVWVWCGRQASKLEKRESVNNAAVNIRHVHVAVVLYTMLSACV